MAPLPERGDAKRAALLVGALAAAIRIVWVLTMSRVPRGLTDLTIYPIAGGSIARGYGYNAITGTPTSYYPPGYPLFLAAVQWTLDRVGLDDHLIVAAGLVQALLGGVTAAAVVVIGRRVGGARNGLRVGVVAGLLVACWPNLVIHSSLMLSETLFLAAFSILVASTLTLTSPQRADGRPTGWWIAAGLSMGVCTLVRPQSAVLFLPAVVAVWALARIGWRPLLRHTAALVLGVVVVVGPWTIRNAVVLDAFVPVSTNNGDNLCIGFNDDATGGFMVADDCQTGEFYTDGPVAEVRRDRQNQQFAQRWILSNLTRLPALSLDKMRITYQHDRDGLRALESFGNDRFLSDGTRRAMGLVVDAYYFTVLALAIGGVGLLARRSWRERRTDPSGLLLLAITAGSALVPVIGFGEARFKVPAAPCFAVLAAVTIVAVWSHFAGDRQPPAEPDDPAADATSVLPTTPASGAPAATRREVPVEVPPA